MLHDFCKQAKRLCEHQFQRIQPHRINGDGNTSVPKRKRTSVYDWASSYVLSVPWPHLHTDTEFVRLEYHMNFVRRLVGVNDNAQPVRVVRNLCKTEISEQWKEIVQFLASVFFFPLLLCWLCAREQIYSANHSSSHFYGKKEKKKNYIPTKTKFSIDGVQFHWSLVNGDVCERCSRVAWQANIPASFAQSHFIRKKQIKIHKY